MKQFLQRNIAVFTCAALVALPMGGLNLIDLFWWLRK